MWYNTNIQPRKSKRYRQHNEICVICYTCNRSRDQLQDDIEIKDDDEKQGEEFYGSNAVMSFDDMDLKADLHRGMIHYGFEKPSAVQ